MTVERVKASFSCVLYDYCVFRILFNLSILSLDVDECNETFAIRLHYCESVCVNILGSYYCNCSVGYQYSHDKQLCVGKIAIRVVTTA